MPKTVSVHNGSAANREHNRRNPRTTGQMPHIQQDLVHHNETWIDIPVREAYKQIFQTAVDDYNRLYKSLYGPITPNVPASILQLHQDVTVVADEDALSLIKEKGLL